MEVPIKDLMDGNPIRGRKGLWGRQSEAGAEQVQGFSSHCLQQSRSMDSGRVKSSVSAPIMTRFVLSEADTLRQDALEILAGLS